MSRFIPLGQEDPISTLCRMVVDTTYEDLPSSVVDSAKQSILDTMAVTIGGSAMEGIPAVVDLVREKGGKGESLIPFYGIRVPASEAGLAIGPMSRAMDFGQLHEEAAHCSEYVLAALLAASGLKAKVTGKEFITAFVAGQELLIRIGIAFQGVSKGVPLGRGSGHAIFGCVAAVGKLIGLSLDELRNAAGIARVMTQPHDLAMYAPATLVIRIHHGFVCQDAINACLLAKKGVTGPQQEVLVGHRGYLGLAKWETKPEALTTELGEKWEMVNVMTKLYAACKGSHTSIYGILEQMKWYNFMAEDIAAIHIEQSSINWSLVCLPNEVKWNPKTVAECQFSLPYVVAAAAHDGGVTLDSYTNESMARENVRDLMTRITAKEDPNLPAFAARVSTTLKDGNEYSKQYAYPKGHPRNPLTEQELVDKFKKCARYSAYKLDDELVGSIIQALLNLEKVDDVMSVVLMRLSP